MRKTESLYRYLLFTLYPLIRFTVAFHAVMDASSMYARLPPRRHYQFGEISIHTPGMICRRQQIDLFEAILF